LVAYCGGRTRGLSSSKTMKIYIIAIKMKKGNEIFYFKSKHDRAMFLDEVSHHGRKKISYAIAEATKK
jgi:hypothetical protein